MSVIDAIRHRLRAVVRARAVQRERDEEIAFHQSLTEQHQRRDGVDGRSARFGAKREFGNETLVKEEIRHMSALRWIDTIAQDLRYGVRTLLRSPVFTIVAVLSLALGIGANTAIFGVLHALMLRPIAVPNPEELVALQHVSREEAGVYDAMDTLDQYLSACGLEEGLLHLVRLRASQLNGCAYCIDMHWKDLRAIGESEQRLYGLGVWRETPGYSERERAALEWTEAVTIISEGHARDDVYTEVQPHFSDKELADLTCAIATINAWNRLSIASRLQPGNYQPAAVAR